MKPSLSALRNSFTGLLASFILMMFAASCGDFKKTNVVAPPSTGGKVDFTRYVSLGNSLVAGYENGALYESAQKYSYPNLIAQEAGVAMGKTVVFNQPLIADPGVGSLNGVTIGHLQIVSLSSSSPDIEPILPPASGVPINALTVQQPYNNLGVPGAFLSDMMDTTSITNPANPFFAAVLRTPALGKSCLQQSLFPLLPPTFITVEIGDNDILGWVTYGGTSVPYTLPQDFDTKYTTLMNTLLAAAPNAKFAIANIPDVTVVPYVTTISRLIVAPDGQPIVVGGKHVPLFVQRHDANGNLYVGQADTVHDFILLSAADSMRAFAGTSPAHPLLDPFVLDSFEVAEARQIIAQYNNTIKQIADAHQDRIALVDVNSLLTNIAQHGYISDGVVLTSAFIEGGLFGLDGIHPTAQGYGVVANEFIRSINARFGSNIPSVVISLLPSTVVLAKSSLQPDVLPNISYADLKPVLQLFDCRLR